MGGTIFAKGTLSNRQRERPRMTRFLLALFAAVTLAGTLTASAQVSSGSTDAAQQNAASKHDPRTRANSRA
jgi:hypothetical protein